MRPKFCGIKNILIGKVQGFFDPGNFLARWIGVKVRRGKKGQRYDFFWWCVVIVNHIFPTDLGVNKYFECLAGNTTKTIFTVLPSTTGGNFSKPSGVNTMSKVMNSHDGRQIGRAA